MPTNQPSRFVGDATDFVIPQCFHCGRYRDRTQDGTDVCEAFPQGIPQAIFLNRIVHDTAQPGDNGLLYVLKQGVKNPPPIRP